MSDIYGPIDAVYKQMYADNVKLQVQLAMNPFEGHFTPIENLRGREMQAVELVGKSQMIRNAPDSSPTPLIPPSHEGIYVQPQRGTWGRTIPKSTAIKAAVEYTSAYVRECSAAAARDRADIINAAITGPRLVRNDDTGVPIVVPFDWANRAVAANYAYGGGGASSGLTVQKFIKAIEKLGITDLSVDMEDISCAMTMKENTDLFNQLQVVNSQYNDRAQFSQKTVRQFMGINIILYNYLPLDPTGTWRVIPFWAKSGVHYGEAVPLEINMERDPGLQFQPVIFAEQWYGATRSEDEKVAVVYSDPTIG